MTRGTGAKPSGTLSQQANATVVKAIDLAVPSVTVLTDENKLVTMKVADKKNLEA